MTTKMAAATAANAVTGFRIGRSALVGLLLSSAAVPALAQTTPAPPQAPAPSSTNTGQIEQTTQQNPSGAPAAPQAGQVANPQTGSTVIENSPQGPQEQQAAPAGLGEIIVTATRRETNLQRTPIAISVANTQALADRHAMSLLDFGDGSIPSLRVATFEARQSALTVGIRGIVPFDQNQTARDVPVGVYVDGIYLARSQGLNAALLDIDRIEVLRRPCRTRSSSVTRRSRCSRCTRRSTRLRARSITSSRPVLPAVPSGALTSTRTTPAASTASRRRACSPTRASSSTAACRSPMSR
jgi:outer membrane receptor protein involved in Fe transport